MRLRTSDQVRRTTPAPRGPASKPEAASPAAVAADVYEGPRRVAPLPPPPAAPALEAPAWVDKMTKRWADRQVAAAIAEVSAQYALTGAEKDALQQALVELGNAKAKEYGEHRGPSLVMGTALRFAVATAAMVLFGLAAPSSVLISAATSSLISLGVGLSTLASMLRHVLRGRAAVELDRLNEQRRRANTPPLPVRKGLLRRFADTIASWFTSRQSAKFALDAEQRGTLDRALREVAAAKTEELWKGRLRVELGATLGSTALAAGVSLLLGLASGPGLVIIGLSGLFGLLTTSALHSSRMWFEMHGAASATLEKLAENAPSSSPLAALNAAPLERKRKALEEARSICERYAKEYGLSEAEHRDLSRVVEKVAVTKQADLWHLRRWPTLLAPVTRGAGVASVGLGTDLINEATAGGILIGALVESGVAGLLLHRQLRGALDGAAHAHVLALQEAAKTRAALAPATVEA